MGSKHIMKDSPALSSKQVKTFTIYSSIFLAVASVCFLVFIQDKSLVDVFLDGYAPHVQIIIGLLVGSILAVVIRYVPFLSSLRQMARHLIGAQLQPKKVEIPLFAYATATGEELLFRAILQPFIGVWLTSVVFTLSHGSFDFKSRGMILFNVFLFISSVVMGLLYMHVGLLAVIMAHGIYNVWIMLYAIKSK